MVISVRKKGSRKTKKDWRKNIDIKKIEDGLDDDRLEQILGGSFHEKKNEDLFVIDKDGDDETNPKSTLENAEKCQSNVTWQARNMRCFSALINRSAVRDPLIKRNRVRSQLERKHPMLKRKLMERIDQGLLNEKEKIGVKNRERYQDERKCNELERKTRRRTVFDSDLWTTETPSKHELVNEWLNEDTKRINSMVTTSNSQNCGHRKKLPSDYNTKPSDLNAISVPHPGLSYNPSLKDHNSLLLEIAATELGQERREKKLERATVAKFNKRTVKGNEDMLIEEMCSGITDQIGVSDTNSKNLGVVEDTIDVEESVEDFKRRTNVFLAKTSKERRQQKERRLQEARIRWSKVKANQETSEFNRLKTMKRELSRNKFLSTIQVHSRLIRKHKRDRFRTKKLSKLELPSEKESTTLNVFKLGSELTGNLQRIRPEGNLLSDRFHSMQKRNLLEVRIKQNSSVKRVSGRSVNRKKRKKVVLKRSHRSVDDLKNEFKKKVK